MEYLSIMRNIKREITLSYILVKIFFSFIETKSVFPAALKLDTELETLQCNIQIPKLALNELAQVLVKHAAVLLTASLLSSFWI